VRFFSEAKGFAIFQNNTVVYNSDFKIKTLNVEKPINTTFEIDQNYPKITEVVSINKNK